MNEERSGVWLNPDEFAHFASYADLFGLDPGTLAGLLVMKAKHQPSRLDKAGSDKLPKRSSSRVRLTLHKGHHLAMNELAGQAANEGIGHEAALRTLIATELKERWFERMMKLESS